MEHVVLGGLVADRRVLLAHRSPSKVAYPGRWDLPGGVVEEGESELDALVRELHEELDVRITTATASPLGRLVAGPGGSRAQISAWLIGTWEGTPTNAAPDEHDAIAWFDIDEMPPLVHEVVDLALRRHGPD